jgi:hypothetical protein
MARAMTEQHESWPHGDVVALRYITTDQRIEMCWPCRVVEDSGTLVALFIAAGSPYRAGPKLSAAAKRAQPLPSLPPDEYVWRADTLRLMLPGRCHSVSLFWSAVRGQRILARYFVNMEEPFRRTRAGFDTQDHTLDIVVAPDLSWQWRDEEELHAHVDEGFYTAELAAAVRAEGEEAIAAILRREHPCMDAWDAWSPDPEWVVPELPAGWDAAPPTPWERRAWAYGVSE